MGIVVVIIKEASILIQVVIIKESMGMLEVVGPVYRDFSLLLRLLMVVLELLLG